MKIFLLCALFAPIIYLALHQKKWYLYLLFAFIAVLPEQFSVRIHDSIPLLSATRLLIVTLAGFWLYGKWKTRTFQFPKSLLLFFAVNLIVSVVNLRYGSDDIKRIFLLVFERVFLVIMLKDMICDREEFNRCIDFAIMGCAALAVIGIVQTVFDYDISSALHLTSTITSIQLNERMGLVRAFGTYNAISYGCYCSVMAFLILYRLYNTRSIWHSIAFALNFVALICTFTRSAWLCLAAVAFLALLIYRLTLIRRMLSSLAITLALLAALCCIQPKLYYAFVETGKSSINTILGVLPDSVISLFTPAEQPAPTTSAETAPNLPDSTESVPATEATVSTQPTETVPVPTTPSTAPQSGDTNSTTSRPGFELDENFGTNASDPTYSRTAQWTAVQYMMEEGDLLFGYGYNALIHGRIHFFFDRWTAKWQPTTFLDVGLVSILTESGLIGFLAQMALLGFIFVYSLLKKSKEDKFDFYHLILLIIPLYLLLNYLASFPNPSIIWILISLFYAYKNMASQNTTPVQSADNGSHPLVDAPANTEENA